MLISRPINLREQAANKTRKLFPYFDTEHVLLTFQTKHAIDMQILQFFCTENQSNTTIGAHNN